MQELSAVSYESGEQHNGTSASRMAKDVSDTHKMVDYLLSRNPFTDNFELFSLFSGMTADESDNVDLVSEVGVIILQNIIGKKEMRTPYIQKERTDDPS